MYNFATIPDFKDIDSNKTVYRNTVIKKSLM